MIEATGIGGGIALATQDRPPRRRPRAVVRRAIATDAVERVEIEDALAAVDPADDRPGGHASADGQTITAAAVARRLVVTADRAVAIQARLGAAAVRRLVGAAW